jgi:uncharacterized OB-fold protein
LSEQQFREQPGAVEFAVDARYDWDAGEAVGAFLHALRGGRLLGRRCDGCGRVLVPPRMFCERCFRPTDAWVEVPATGRVETFSICHVSWDMRDLDPPEVPAVVRLDESDGGILHKLGDVEPEAVSIGMAVEAVWRPEPDRTGSILDIAHFCPAEGGHG